MNDGGVAFPSTDEFVVCNKCGEVTSATRYLNGMSLLDYFAGQALMGLVVTQVNRYNERSLSRWSYDIAQAMIKERERRMQGER